MRHALTAATSPTSRRSASTYEALDGTHPTARGMRQLASMIATAIEDGASDPRRLPAALFEESLRSVELCPGASCIGCAHAKNTGNSWFLVCEKDA